MNKKTFCLSLLSYTHREDLFITFHTTKAIADYKLKYGVPYFRLVLLFGPKKKFKNIDFNSPSGKEMLRQAMGQPDSYYETWEHAKEEIGGNLFAPYTGCSKKNFTENKRIKAIPTKEEVMKRMKLTKSQMQKLLLEFTITEIAKGKWVGNNFIPKDIYLCIPQE